MFSGHFFRLRARPPARTRPPAVAGSDGYSASIYIYIYIYTRLDLPITSAGMLSSSKVEQQQS